MLTVVWISGPVQPFAVFGLDPDTAVEKYIHHQWTTRDGLPQDTIYSIVQDRKGYIWLGTDRGAVRFDGFSFKTFNTTNTPALKNNSVTSLLLTRDGTLYIGTYGGSAVLYKDRQFRPIPGPDNPDAPANLFINTMLEDRQRNILLGTTGSGIIRLYDSSFDVFTRTRRLAFNIVSCLCSGSRGNLWIGTEKGLYCSRRGTITLYGKEHGLAGNNITALFEDSRGYLWVGTTGGVSRFRSRRERLKKNDRGVLSIDINNGLAGNIVKAVLEDKDGNIWAATNGGLNRITARAAGEWRGDGAGIETDRFTMSGGLSDNVLLSLCEDRWGNLWIGTASGGLNVLREGKFSFYTEKDGLSESYVKTVFEDRSGVLWIGTHGGGLNRKENDTFNVYTRDHGLSSNFIESISQDRQGNLWIGTPNGLNRFMNDTFEIFTTRQGLSNNSVKVLYADSKDNLWIGTQGGGLNRLREGKFQHFNTSHGLSGNFILALGEDSYGNIWIGTDRGVNSYDGQLFRQFSGKKNVPAGMVLDIYCDTDGAVWAATDSEGLFRYKDGVFTQYGSEWGLAGKAIYRILEDNRGSLWLSSNSGIYSISRRRLNAGTPTVDWRHFQEDDGLKTAVCTGGSQPAGWKTRDGTIWFPTIQGIAAMNLGKSVFAVETRPVLPLTPIPEGLPEDLKGISFVTVVREQPVIIERITADGKTIEMHNPFELPAGTGTVEFRFVALNFRTPGKTLFKYRLFGHDSKWQLVRANRAVYKNLPSGEYEFKVYARNSDGNWSYENDSFNFLIRYTFFQSFWFYVVLTTILVLLIKRLPRIQERILWRQASQVEDKYKRSSLTPGRSKRLLDRLLGIMEQEKPYLDPAMSLQMLAQRLDISKEDLSQVINEQLGKNFKNFLNFYRIEEAKKKLLDPRENQFVLLKIAFDVGFNSKSAFNASFKKVTGISPSEFRKSRQDQPDK
jgi:ligand-binding sensor domain-containing protein/AraC-like DNA-binding protein